MISATRDVQGVEMLVEIDLAEEHPVVHATAPGVDWTMKFHCDACAKTWFVFLGTAIDSGLDVERSLEMADQLFRAASSSKGARS